MEKDGEGQRDDGIFKGNWVDGGGVEPWRGTTLQVLLSLIQPIDTSQLYTSHRDNSCVLSSAARIAATLVFPSNSLEFYQQLVHCEKAHSLIGATDIGSIRTPLPCATISILSNLPVLWSTNLP
jgi:hypothetical protein